MRGEIPCGVHVAAHGAEIRPHGGERTDVADFASVHEVLHFEDAGIEEKNVANYEHEALILCEREELLALGGFNAQRLFAEDVLARVQRLGDDGEVGLRGRDDDDGIHAAVAQERRVTDRREAPVNKVFGAKI